VGTRKQSFSHEDGLKFSEKVGIFQKMSISPKKSSSFLHGSLDAAFHCSGVARVTCALGQDIFLRPRQQKLQSLK